MIWGIEESSFLLWYGGAALGTLATMLAVRLRITRRRPTEVTPDPGPAEIAYLVAGPGPAVYTALAALRAGDAIGAEPGPSLSVTGPMPVGLTRLDLAVYHAAGRGLGVGELAADPGVAAELVEVGAAARASDWSISSADRRRVRSGLWLVLPLAALGLARLGTELVQLLNGTIVDGDPAGLTGALLGFFFLAGVLYPLPTLSALGRRAYRRLREREAHLYPSGHVAWIAAGPAAAARGVALFGTAALWSADPGFAAVAGVPLLHTKASGVVNGPVHVDLSGVIGAPGG